MFAPAGALFFFFFVRTVLHAGENEVIVRGYRRPALLGEEGRGRESLCDDDEVGKEVDPFVRRHCPHELWLALDMDSYIVGDGDLGDDREDNKAWKKWIGRYYHSDQFTLRVSWAGSVSRRRRRHRHPPPQTKQTNIHRLLKQTENLNAMCDRDAMNNKSIT